MSLSKPTSQHQQLRIFIGNWLGEETLHPSAINPVLDTATTKAERTALGEFFVLSNHTQQRRSGSVFFNHLVFGWDDKQQKFTMWQFDSTGQSTDILRGLIF